MYRLFVSIPNGTPPPLRLRRNMPRKDSDYCFNPQRDAAALATSSKPSTSILMKSFQSPTGRRRPCDSRTLHLPTPLPLVSHSPPAPPPSLPPLPTTLPPPS